jgi:hypothetical protein
VDHKEEKVANRTCGEEIQAGGSHSRQLFIEVNILWINDEISINLCIGGLKKETYSKEKHHKNQVENEDHWSHSEFVHEELDS